jgi:hypothetical protein
MLRLLLLDLGIQGQLAMKQYLRRFPIQAHRKDAQP